MEARLIALKLVLGTLGVSDDISTLDDRKRVQKAVYLGQVAGVDLSYRFGWYLMGPYSTSLARDYYELARATDPDDAARRQKLAEPAQRVLQKIAPMFTMPEGVSVAPEQWLELLASYHYLRTVRKLDDGEARTVLAAEKAALAPFADLAANALAGYGLLAGHEVREARS